MEKKNPIEEARRYVDNAKRALSEHGEYDSKLRRYENRKYVRTAGHYLWHAVLMAIDAVFHVRKDRRTRVDIEASGLQTPSSADARFYWVDGYF